MRLYAEEDFDGRPRFTDPEILRTNLASVLLQMAAAGLGDVEDFPFLDPPDRRQVRDGVRLLQELAAFDDAERLTPLGRRLAQLPVDPRLGRMVLEADRLGCAGEVIVIAAALSIQDPRERPADKREDADRHHARFAAEGSDFLAYVNLWSYVREQQRALSGNQFRKLCHGEFLHHLRVREWQDLVGQLRQAAKGVGITLTQEPAEPESIHTALLAGLLSHLGMRDPAKRDYLGARGARFALFPGSALARKQPSWVMVAELVETSRLWGRTAAKIDPLWVEPLAAHLIKRSYEEPHWERKRASVVALERATLYGLPVVAGRKVAYGKIDPELSRSLFIRRALVEGDWETRHAFFAANRGLLEEVEELEHRARRRDIVVADQALYDFYDARIPPDVVSGAHFDRWWKDERRRAPALLDFTRADLRRRRRRRARPARAARGVAPGRLHAAAELRLRPRLRARRRDRARAAQAAAAARADRVRLAGAGAAAGARHGADPLAAEGPAPAAGARARGRGGGARAARAAQRAAARRARPRARAAARRAHPARRLRPLAGSRRTCACASASRTSAARSSPRATTSTRCASRPGRGCARRSRPPPRRSSATACASGRSARCRRSSRCPAPARRCAAIPRWSTRATPSACACSRRPRRRARRCTPARAS